MEEEQKYFVVEPCYLETYSCSDGVSLGYVEDLFKDETIVKEVLEERLVIIKGVVVIPKVTVRFD